MAPNDPSLLGLPYEVREEIYHYLSLQPPTFNYYAHNPPLHPLLQTCSKLRTEYSEFFYNSHIFHLRIVSTIYYDENDPCCGRAPFNINTNRQKSKPTHGSGGLNVWKELPILVLQNLKEVMIHISPDILKSLCFIPGQSALSGNQIVASSSSPSMSTSKSKSKSNEKISGLAKLKFPYVASFLSLAPNIEILHINACISTAEIRIMVNFINEVLRESVLPNLMRLVLHLDQRIIRRVMTTVEGRKDIEWCKGESKSFAIGLCGRSHLQEHTFRVTDQRRLPRKEKKQKDNNQGEIIFLVKTKKTLEGKRKMEYIEITVDDGQRNFHPSTPIGPGTVAVPIRSSQVGNSSEYSAATGQNSQQITLSSSSSPSLIELEGVGKVGKMTVTQLRGEIDRINRLIAVRDKSRQLRTSD